jgi:DNA-binding beta-propeller fold protein YncE
VKFLLLTFLLAGPSLAGSLGGPLPGFILDPRSGSLRPILGIPGAMQLGTAISLPFQAASADFDATGNVAIVISNETPAHLYVVQNLSNPVITDMGAVADNSSILAINSTGKSALLSAPGQLQFLSDIGGSNLLSPGVSTAGLLGAITAGVLNDQGTCALVGTAVDSTAALETLCGDGTSQRFITQAGMRIAAIDLSNGGRDAVIADVAGQQILRAADYANSGNLSVLAATKDGINTPVGLQVSGQSVFVADSAASSIFVIDLSGQTQVRGIALGSAPARFKFLPDRTIALLNDPTVALFTIFDLQAMQSFFIPTN